MLLLAASLFFTNPTPLEMPRAEAYFVRDEKGAQYLEDRYNTLDLWTAQAVLGRWEDDDGRRFTVAKLDVVPPETDDEPSETRADYAAGRVDLDRRDKSIKRLRNLALSKLSPIDIPGVTVPLSGNERAVEPAKPRQEIRGLDDVLYYQGTNRNVIVCEFLPEKSRHWYLATWELIDGDDYDYSLEQFEKDFLMQWEDLTKADLRSESGYANRPRRSRSDRPTKPDACDGRSERSERSPSPAAEGRFRERELLRADAHHSVTNYTLWHVTDAPEFSVLDDLPREVRFVTTLTNELPVMRAKYAAAVPSPVDGTNVLAVARIFRDRDEYLDAIGEDMEWTAAYWSPSRRELVAYLPRQGSDELLKTIRHEAFHQYLSYACAMMSASPWFNEGYAQYFENEGSSDWEVGNVPLDYDKLAELIPAVLQMDYGQFYAGTDLERRLKYRLAWSLVYFLEKGAPKVRFEPFRGFSRKYVAALLQYKDMRTATAATFGSQNRLTLFIAEWKKFWKNM